MLRIAIAVGGVGILAYLVTVLVFGLLTSWGRDYGQTVYSAPSTQRAFINTDNQPDLTIGYVESDTAIEFNISRSGTRLGSISALALDSSVIMQWENASEVARRLASLGLDARRKGTDVLYGFSGAVRVFPFALNTYVGVSDGALKAWFEDKLWISFLGAGTAAPNQEVIDGISRSMAGLVQQKYRVAEFQGRAWSLSLYGGPIQFVTLFIAIVALGVLAAGYSVPVLTGWAEQLAELIPFVGFYGTLLGMSQALVTLGGADLSNDISKTLSLGAIGSQLGLAIETTKFAIVCFGGVTFIRTVLALFRR
ncbi:hypothetical protein EOA25_21695 [Mesorhizobium sp. M2A.F.Ca.ET.040.01.1.1]|nr:hypothetical protein EOA25_21695 [Mesorhizobium sp. M2A.F.Ca.ET.040.01.1.1]